MDGGAAVSVKQSILLAQIIAGSGIGDAAGKISQKLCAKKYPARREGTIGI